VEDWLAAAFVVVGLIGTAFWVLVAVGPKWEWWAKHLERLDDRARERRDEGYKVNPGALFGWFMKTRRRAIGIAIFYVLWSAWFASFARSS
jgi:hypothetical protein